MRATALTITFGLYSESRIHARPPNSYDGSAQTHGFAKNQSLTTESSGKSMIESFEVPCLNRRDVAGRVLEMFAGILCTPQDTSNIKKFARAVTSKVGHKTICPSSRANQREVAAVPS